MKRLLLRVYEFKMRLTDDCYSKVEFMPEYTEMI